MHAVPAVLDNWYSTKFALLVHVLFCTTNGNKSNPNMCNLYWLITKSCVHFLYFDSIPAALRLSDIDWVVQPLSSLQYSMYWQAFSVFARYSLADFDNCALHSLNTSTLFALAILKYKCLSVLFPCLATWTFWCCVQRNCLAFLKFLLIAFSRPLSPSLMMRVYSKSSLSLKQIIKCS